jgi:hypothetical protein
MKSRTVKVYLQFNRKDLNWLQKLVCNVFKIKEPWRRYRVGITEGKLFFSVDEQKVFKEK